MLKNVIFKIKRENVKTPNKVRNVNVNLKSDPDLHRAALKGSVYRLLYLWRCLVCADSRRKAGTKKKKKTSWEPRQSSESSLSAAAATSYVSTYMCGEGVGQYTSITAVLCLILSVSWEYFALNDQYLVMHISIQLYECSHWLACCWWYKDGSSVCL